MFLKLKIIKVRLYLIFNCFLLLDLGLFGSVNNYNREKNKRRKINSSGGNNINKNKTNKNNINEADYFLIKARTPNFAGKNINYLNINNTKDKNKIKKPRTPEIKNMNNKNNRGINKDNSYQYKNSKRPATAPHNKLKNKK